MRNVLQYRLQFFVLTTCHLNLESLRRQNKNIGFYIKEKFTLEQLYWYPDSSQYTNEY